MRRPFPVKATVVACGAVSLDPPRFHSHSERARGPVQRGVRWMSAAVCPRDLLSQGSVRAVTLDTAC